MPVQRYQLVGHRLCPYVQRVVITLLELNLAFDRTDIDLDDKPDWLKKISPAGQVPVLRVGDEDWLFESDAIARYLDLVSGGGLMPCETMARATHEAWMSYADGMLRTVARIIYRDGHMETAKSSINDLVACLDIVAARFPPKGYFAGREFGLVDAVYATLFRYFPVLDLVSGTKIRESLHSSLNDWWNMVRARPSIQFAVPQDYEPELRRFIASRTVMQLVCFHFEHRSSKHTRPDGKNRPDAFGAVPRNRVGMAPIQPSKSAPVSGRV